VAPCPFRAVGPLADGRMGAAPLGWGLRFCFGNNSIRCFSLSWSTACVRRPLRSRSGPRLSKEPPSTWPITRSGTRRQASITSTPSCHLASKESRETRSSTSPTGVGAWIWPNFSVSALDCPVTRIGTRSGRTWHRYPRSMVCTGGPCPYLPGNGGLLYAVALMAAGWEGAPKKHAPGVS